jgi:ABC-type antimicrobial peptide transport system permease subunit
MLFAGFAVLALVLAALGLYGVLSHVVGQRTPEIGIRMALGARPGAVIGMVVGQGMIWVAAGACAGLIAAGVLTRLLATVLVDVDAVPAAMYAGAIATLLGVALLACAAPAWRASRVDPALVLKD